MIGTCYMYEGTACVSYAYSKFNRVYHVYVNAINKYRGNIIITFVLFAIKETKQAD